jgi:hypothetical protein
MKRLMIVGITIAVMFFLSALLLNKLGHAEARRTIPKSSHNFVNTYAKQEITTISPEEATAYRVMDEQKEAERIAKEMQKQQLIKEITNTCIRKETYDYSFEGQRGVAIIPLIPSECQFCANKLGRNWEYCFDRIVGQ